jgi:hypothetical protein
MVEHSQNKGPWQDGNQVQSCKCKVPLVFKETLQIFPNNFAFSPF